MGAPSDIPSAVQQKTGGREWGAPSYAYDLNWYQPKYQFMFKVIFDLYPEYQEFFQNQHSNNFQYVIKTIQRPRLVYNYEEVNLYNYRTKILKTTSYEPLTISMIDDFNNTLHYFIQKFQQAYSPIANFNPVKNAGSNILRDKGFDFGSKLNSAGRQHLKDELATEENFSPTPLRSIQIFHFTEFGNVTNKFIFTNPRINSINFDELTYAGGEGNYIELTFDFDAVYIEDPENTNINNAHKADITDINIVNPASKQNAIDYTLPDKQLASQEDLARRLLSSAKAYDDLQSAKQPTVDPTASAGTNTYPAKKQISGMSMPKSYVTPTPSAIYDSADPFALSNVIPSS